MSLIPEIDSNKMNNAKLYYDEEGKEFYTLIDFKAVKKYVPNHIYQVRIKQINISF